GGMPVEEHARDGLGGFLRELVSVAIDVYENVFSPIGRSFAREGGAIVFALEVAIEPLDLFVAAVRIGDRVDKDDEIFADAANHRLIGNGEAIGEFEDGFSGTSFVGMEGSIEIVDGARGGDEFFGGGGIGFAGVGEGGGGGFELIEAGNSLFIGDGYEEDFAAFFGFADGEDADAGRGCG